MVARARLAALLAAEVLAVLALHRLGAGLAVAWGDVAGWLHVTSAADAVVVALRYAGLAAGWWLLAGTVAYVLARLTRLGAAVPAVARLTIPAVRRIVDRAVATGVAASVLLAGPVPALAELVVSPPAAAPEEAADGLVVPPPAGGAPAAPGPSAAAPRPSAAAPAVHVVVAGEHLWGIAAAVVARQQGSDVHALAPADVAPYWLRVVADNRPRLRSDDPDLIFPGERVVLPPLTGR